MDAHSNPRGLRHPSLNFKKIYRKMNIDEVCWVIAHVSNSKEQYVYGLKFAITQKEWDRFYSNGDYKLTVLSQGLQKIYWMDKIIFEPLGFPENFRPFNLFLLHFRPSGDLWKPKKGTEKSRTKEGLTVQFKEL